MSPPYPNTIIYDSSGVKAMHTNRAHTVVDSLRPTSFPREPLIGT
jgi:hypothetical protein